jgi:hypothetical protein
MRAMLASAALVGALLLVLGGVQAQGTKGKEVTLKGTITCAKCDLGTAQKCQTVIVTKDKDGKDVVVYFDPASHGKNHKEICSSPKQGSVTGTVSEKDGKKVIAAKKVNFE